MVERAESPRPARTLLLGFNEVRSSKLQVIAFGKIKNPSFAALVADYRARIQTWIPLEETELKQHPERALAHRLETEAFDACVSQSARPRLTVVLDSGGKSWTTEQWSEQLAARDYEVNLAIGSTWGWSADILQRKNVVRVSFGQQTMAHELARVVLFEQIYRALCVTRNHPYHVQKDATL